MAKRESDTVEVADKIYAFFDSLSPDAKLLICGAGHIAVPLARFTREVGRLRREDADFHRTAIERAASRSSIRSSGSSIPTESLTRSPVTPTRLRWPGSIAAWDIVMG